MAYQLKSTGIAANCTMCIAVDPDTNTIKDFASASVTSNMVVGANVTISEQAWDGITRKYFRLGSGSLAADFVEFGASARPQWDFNSGESRTWVWIGEVAGAAARAFGGSSSAFMASQNTATGGATLPATVLGTSTTGGATALTSGTKQILGASLVHGTSVTHYWAADTAASMSTNAGAGISPSGTAFDFALQYVGRRNDNATKQQDKIHAVLIFNTALTEAQWDSLRDDWFGTLLESGGGGDVTAPVLTSPTGAGGLAVCSGTVSTNEGNGTLYAVATASATAPSAAQVKLGQDHTGAAALRVFSQAVSSAGTQTVNSGSISGGAGTRYLHYMHEDAAGNQSAVVSSAGFEVTATATQLVLSVPDAAGLSGFSGIVLSAAAPGSGVTVIATPTGINFNGSGQATINVTGLGIPVGARRWVSVTNSTGDPAQSPAPVQAQGPVAAS